MEPMYTFSEALEKIKSGARMCRAGWNGKGMHIFLRDAVPDRQELPFIMMKTVDEKFVPWLASQTDLLAEDWFQVI